MGKSGSLRAAVAALAAALVPGCAFFTLDRELEEVSRLFVATGEARAAAASRGAIVVVAHAGGQPAAYDVLRRPGRYALVLPAGRYRISAFEDANANRRWDAGEAGATIGPVEPEALGLRLHEDLDVALAPAASPPAGFPAEPTAVARRPVELAEFGAGVSLEARTFARDYGELGLWRPHTFIYEAAPGVHPLEAYDPSRIPVLFVHGAGGTPRDWEHFVEALDPARYQPWVFHYASGLSLEVNAVYLERTLHALHGMYGFSCLFVAAHSVGGLVAKRSVDLSREAGDGYVRLLVSIATPFGGIESAGFGARNAPVAMPLWADLAPGSAFLRRLYARPLAPFVPHLLVFTYGREEGLRLANTDGKVTLASQLDTRVKDHAFAIDGTADDHRGVMSSEAAIARIEEAMRAVAFSDPACRAAARPLEARAPSAD